MVYFFIYIREKGYLEKISKSVGKFDIIFENLSNVNLGDDLTVLKPNARVAVSIINN